MKPKTIFTILLSAFVVFSFAEMAIKRTKLQAESYAPKASVSVTSTTLNDVNLRADRLAVYYFHGNVRCENCRAIEANANEAVHGEFTRELAEGSVEWKVINFDEADNKHFDKDFELGGIPSVVLIKIRGGERKNFKSLTDVWQLVITGEKKAFLDYVRKEIRDFQK